jgi:hypothetical protein
MLVQNKIEKEDIVAIKFASGEEVIARYLGEDVAAYNVDKIMSIVAGQRGIALSPFMFGVELDEKGYPKTPCTLLKASILVIAPASPDITQQFKTSISGIQQVTKSKIIL